MDTEKTYRTAIYALIAPGPTRVFRDMSATEAAKYLAVLAADYGRPTSVVCSVDAKNVPVAKFVFSPGSLNGQHFSVVGLTPEDLRAAYRASA